MISVERILNDTDYLSCLSADEMSAFGSSVVDVCLNSVTTVLNILSLTCDSKGNVNCHVYYVLKCGIAEIALSLKYLAFFTLFKPTLFMQQSLRKLFWA